MATAERASPIAIRDLLARVGKSLLQVGAAATGSLDRPVIGLQLVDPLSDVTPSAGHLLLAVGVRPNGAEATKIVAAALAGDAAGVIFHAHSPIPGDLVAAAESSLTLLLSPIDVGWDHLLSILRRGLEPHDDDVLGGVPMGDLFGFANALAVRIGGAVTVEDPESRVLAYSTVHDDIDQPRRETILGRRVPDRYTRRIGEVLRALRTDDAAIDVPADPEVGRRRRLVIAIRAAGEAIGSIWVADVGVPFSDDAHDILTEASRTAALHFIRHSTDLRHDATVKDGLVHQLLDGSSTPDVVAIHLGLEPDAALMVVAFEATGDSPAVNRLRQVVTAHGSAFRHDLPVVDRGPRVYLVLPAPTGLTPEVRRWVAEAAGQASAAVGAQVVAGIGTRVDHAGAVPQSRADADRALRVLLRSHGVRDTVAWLPDVLAHANLLEVLDVLRERPHLQRSRIDALRDDPRNELFVATVRAYLTHFGDVRSAAASLRIHPNTFRYRLRRAVELSGLNLDDHSERLVVALQLQLDG